MFSAEEMQKIRVICLYEDKAKVTSILHSTGLVELRKSKAPIEEDEKPEYSGELSDMLIKVENAMHVLRKREETPERHLGTEKLLKELKSMQHVFNEIHEAEMAKKKVHEDTQLLEYGKYVAKSFETIDVNFNSLKSELLKFNAFEATRKEAESVVKAIKNSGLDIEYINKSIGKDKHIIFLTYSRETNVEPVMKRFRLKELDLNAKYLNDVPKKVLNGIEKKKEENVKALKDAEKQIEKLSDKYYSKLANIKEMLEIELERAEASDMFKRTEKTLLVEGWVPKKRVQEVKAAVESIADNNVHFEELEADELAPTLVNRPGFLKPFDYLVQFFSPQRSDEVDPTWIFIAFFPIFYGLMISDAGYGIVSAIFSWWLAKRSDPDGLLYNVAKIWQLNSIAVIFFGVLSNQYFGFALNEYIGLGDLKWLNLISFDWMKDIIVITGLSLIFGMSQVIIGLLFGFWNNYKKHNMPLAIARLASVLVIIFGAIAISGALFHMAGETLTMASAVIAIASVVVVLVLSGEEAVEIVNLLGHPLSYARLMGFGLASVILAVMIDKGFTPHLSAGIIPFILTLIVFIALHMMNMFISMFEGAVQGIRLNFIEFFSKFYSGGGRAYKPFSYRRKHTKE